MDVTVWKVIPGRGCCKSGWQASVYLFEVGQEQKFLEEKNPPHELEFAFACLSKTPESARDVLASARPIRGWLRGVSPAWVDMPKMCCAACGQMAVPVTGTSLSWEGQQVCDCLQHDLSRCSLRASLSRQGWRWCWVPSTCEAQRALRGCK